MAVDGVQVEGLAELERALRMAAPELDRALRRELVEIAEPVRRDVERLAVEHIRNLGPKWGRMRIGVTRREVYVAPRQRGLKTRGHDPRRRPNLATLMEQRAMEPALASNVGQIEAGVEHVLAEFASEWSR